MEEGEQDASTPRHCEEPEGDVAIHPRRPHPSQPLWQWRAAVHGLLHLTARNDEGRQGDKRAGSIPAPLHHLVIARSRKATWQSMAGRPHPSQPLWQWRAAVHGLLHLTARNDDRGHGPHAHHRTLSYTRGWCDNRRLLFLNVQALTVYHALFLMRESKVTHACDFAAGKVHTRHARKRPLTLGADSESHSFQNCRERSTDMWTSPRNQAPRNQAETAATASMNLSILPVVRPATLMRPDPAM